MKQLLHYIVFCCLAACCFTACDHEDIFRQTETEGDGNSIILNLASGKLPLTRANVEANGAEIAVSHLDVLIFNQDGTKVWHERVDGIKDGKDKITLSAQRSTFDENESYWVYLIANSTADVSIFEDENFTLTSLNALKQEDKDIHMTGLASATGVPQTFLMDGVAYPKGEQEPATVKMVVLNSGDKTNDTELQTVLRRAAAKIVVNIKSGEHVQFDNGPQTYHAGYYLRNMPYSTSVIKPAMMDKDDAELMTPELNNGGYFKWTPSVITVTAYAYAHVWDNASTLEKEVRLIVNIPMNYLPDNATEWKFLDNSYYQIPVSTKKELNRNTCYEVNVTVDAPGGSNPSKPVLLKDISYSVRDWDEERINVGGDTDRPAYLTLNEYEMEMHNMADDNTTLEFASSSEVTATIDRVYYIDKFGQEKELTQITNGSADEWGENIGSDYRPNWKNRCIIKITPDENITGKIQVHGDVPGNNAVRYIIFTVENEEGIKREVKVAQYPLEYITNIQGWYSYRSDFGGTTWENYRDPSQKRVSAYNYDSRNDTWSYSATRYGNDYIFTSKVAEEIETGSNRGKSSISYYYYKLDRWQTSLSTNEIWNAGNARMYHVQITASSGDYTLGQPRITNGKTDPGEDNAELVSPSFMIASQLGAVFSISDEEMAASHCREYVEVAQDGTVYDDWRLPTRAELEIIMEFQYKENAAMDEVLAGPSYWSASGLVYNNKGSGTAKTIRCIRDAYDKKTGK
ncbi:hypothetical protein [Phocaeicola sp.]|uniref:fimbrial tip adhesin FimD n=1 Tax=Phocaeicola sp. TaxID=2773926 RepID=UPI003AF99EA0